mgnify:CR=1 FL=1
MFTIRYATAGDEPFWFMLDSHLRRQEFERKVRDRQGYIIGDGDKPVGIMRYNLFWDEIPFLTLIHLDEPYQRKGFGQQGMIFWESEMRQLGYKMVMTSTQVNEEAQHFYRKLGFVDRGSLFLDGTPHDQPQEMFMIKVIA